jgi:hypothetical protein
MVTPGEQIDMLTKDEVVRAKGTIRDDASLQDEDGSVHVSLYAYGRML